MTEDLLVCAQRPSLTGVPIPDRLAVRREMLEHGPGQMGRRDPQALRPGEALEQGETTTAVEAEVASEVFGHRARGVVRGLPSLDEPQSAGELG